MTGGATGVGCNFDILNHGNGKKTPYRLSFGGHGHCGRGPKSGVDRLASY